MITGFRSPLISLEFESGTESFSDVGTVDENAWRARSLALVLVATESDICCLLAGPTGGLALELENVCDRRSCSRTGRRGFNQSIYKFGVHTIFSITAFSCS